MPVSFKLTFDPSTRQALRELAERNGLSEASTIKMLVTRAHRAEFGTTVPAPVAPVAPAAPVDAVPSPESTTPSLSTEAASTPSPKKERQPRATKEKKQDGTPRTSKEQAKYVKEKARKAGETAIAALLAKDAEDIGHSLHGLQTFLDRATASEAMKVSLYIGNLPSDLDVWEGCQMVRRHPFFALVNEAPMFMEELERLEGFKPKPASAEVIPLPTRTGPISCTLEDFAERVEAPMPSLLTKEKKELLLSRMVAGMFPADDQQAAIDFASDRGFTLCLDSIGTTA